LNQGVSVSAATSGPEQASLLIGPENETSRKLLARLKPDTPIHLDTLVDDTDSSPSELLAALFELEMMGLVKQLPGKNFVRVWIP